MQKLAFIVRFNNREYYLCFMLLPFYQKKLIEAGCDEAGRGCYAGPVFAAAVILPKKFKNNWINDSKKLSEPQRNDLRSIIEEQAICWAVASIGEQEIDSINILKASIKAMHVAIKKLATQPEYLLIDGNRFYAYPNIPHQTVIKGDGIYLSIAAASILAKTHRDAYMQKLDAEFPQYGWAQNKGYGTLTHRKAIAQHGLCPYHRKSFNILPKQGELF
jgi:ribonuclease HII